MSAATEAVTLATKLNQIGFVEFTTKLITDIFDTIVASNLKQTRSYFELVEQVSKTLTQFISDNKTSIGGDSLLQFFARTVPDPKHPTGTKIRSDNMQKLTATEANKLNAALFVDGVPASTTTVPTDPSDPSDPSITPPEDPTGSTNPDPNAVPGPANTTKSIKMLYPAIANAATSRIAADKYKLLKEMVKMGIVRLVVESGEINTRLTFTTSGSDMYTNNAKKYNTDDFNFSLAAKTGSALASWLTAEASVGYTSTSVTSADSSTTNSTNSSVELFGSVTLKFKTDYQPLNTQ
ncbi:hypothetical protein [Clostridium tarantellae]|uniref:Uncharacterized protein n=1 Tax=Clostridium tarantellae TaxID=39493 RepID=A0A6I1MHZ0_9CLOT|nr:hypothetical protein [Clostridium tarantellae]MPQ43156.1 hypothetical protein [Clostridium tarantellae]